MIEKILDELIEEAKQNPEWKAEQALRCAKKELLKAYAPRVLTLDEIRTLPEGTDVWVEERDGSIRVDTSCVTIDERWFETYLHSFLLADYGTAWRPWTARPTGEQRMAMPWQGGKT